MSQKGSSQNPSAEILDDLCSRFVLNGPPEDLQSFERLLFLVEQAHWYYEDTVRERSAGLRSYGLRDFTVLLFQHCPALHPYTQQVHQIYADFNAYKVKVPVAGAIILDTALQHCLLVKGWKSGASWGFPRGKKSKNEEDHECAQREVLEETGFDIGPFLDPADYLESAEGGRRCRLFVISGVDMNTATFGALTKQEISEIAWHPLIDLMALKQAAGSKFYMVQPFMRPIGAWIKAHHTPHTRALAIRCPAVTGTTIPCWKAPAESIAAAKEAGAGGTSSGAASGVSALTPAAPSLPILNPERPFSLSSASPPPSSHPCGSILSLPGMAAGQSRASPVSARSHLGSAAAASAPMLPLHMHPSGHEASALLEGPRSPSPAVSLAAEAAYGGAKGPLLVTPFMDPKSAQLLALLQKPSVLGRPREPWSSQCAPASYRNEYPHLFATLRNFRFDMQPIMDALQF